jgi:phosphatidylglycerophosphate synthase
MRIFIDATALCADEPLALCRIEGRPVIEYFFVMAKKLRAGHVSVKLPAEAREDVKRLADKYFKEGTFTFSDMQEGAFDLAMDIKNFYDPAKVRKEYDAKGELSGALIWTVNSVEDLKACESEYVRTKWFPIGRYYIVPISKFLASRIAKTGMTANQVTLVSFILGMLSGVLLFFNDPMCYFLAALCHLLFWILDITDGKVARLKRSVSAFGKWFDPVAGEIVDYFVHFCIVLSLYMRTGLVVFIWIGMFYFIGKHLTLFAMQMGSQVLAKEKAEGLPFMSGNGFMSAAPKIAHLVHDADIRVHVMCLFMLLNMTAIPLIVYAVYFNLWFAVKFAMETKRGLL